MENDSTIIANSVPMGGAGDSNIFKDLPNSPVAFNNASSVVLDNGDIFVVNGQGNISTTVPSTTVETGSNQCWKYSFGRKIWERMADLPEYATGLTLVKLSGNKALATGIEKNIITPDGLSSSITQTASYKQYIYSLETNTWERISDFYSDYENKPEGTIPTALTGMAGIETEPGKIIFIGGKVQWEIANSNTSAILIDIIYNNNLFIAIGNDGAILTSSDGITWIPRTSGTSYHLRNITYSNNLFIAIGLNGTILTSTDGITWMPRTSGIGSGLYGSTYGNGLFIVAGIGGTILTSTDGITWTPRTSNSTEVLWSSTYGNGLFIVAGAGGTILTSTDGITWTPRTSNSTDILHRIVYKNNLFIVTGVEGTILTSTDGITWTPRTSGVSIALYSIAYGNGLFTIIGLNGTILISSDGITWTIKNIRANLGLYGNVYINGIFIIVGNNGYIGRCSNPFLTDNILEFDLNTKMFSKKAEMIEGQYNKLSIAKKDSDLYIALGSKWNFTSNAYENNSGILKYSLTNESLVSLPAVPSGSGNQNLVPSVAPTKIAINGNKLLAVNSGSNQAVIYEYDLTKEDLGTWIIKNTIPNLTVSNIGSALSLKDGKIAFICNSKWTTSDGLDSNAYKEAFKALTYNHSIDILDKTVYDITIPQSIPPHRFSLSTTFKINDNEIIITGDYEQYTALAGVTEAVALAALTTYNKVYKYNIATDVWSEVASMTPNSFPVSHTKLANFAYGNVYGSVQGSAVRLDANRFLVNKGAQRCIAFASGTGLYTVTNAVTAECFSIYNATTNTWEENIENTGIGTYAGKLLVNSLGEILFFEGMRELYAPANNIYKFNPITKTFSIWKVMDEFFRSMSIVQNPNDINKTYICSSFNTKTSTEDYIKVYELDLISKEMKLLVVLPKKNATSTGLKSGFSTVTNSIIIQSSTTFNSTDGATYDLYEYNLDSNELTQVSSLPKDIPANGTSGYGAYGTIEQIDPTTILYFGSTLSKNMAIVRPNQVQRQNKINRSTTLTAPLSSYANSAAIELNEPDSVLSVGGVNATAARLVIDYSLITIANIVKNNGIYDIKYLNGIYFITCDQGVLFRSTDGITWTKLLFNSTMYHRDITYGNGVYLLTSLGVNAANGWVHSSVDGINWVLKVADAPYSNISGIAYNPNNNTFVLSSVRSGGAGGLIFSSIDNGTTWTLRHTATDGKGFIRTVFVNNTFIAVGNLGDITTSTDGITWTVRTSGVTVDLWRTAYGNGIYVVVGAAGTILTSIDLITWTSRTSNYSGTMRDILFSTSANVFVVAGEDNVILTSNDGITWTHASDNYLPSHSFTALMQDSEYHYTMGAKENTLVKFKLVPGEVSLNSSIVSRNLVSGKAKVMTTLPSDIGVSSVSTVALDNDKYIISGLRKDAIELPAVVGTKSIRHTLRSRMRKMAGVPTNYKKWTYSLSVKPAVLGFHVLLSSPIVANSTEFFVYITPDGTIALYSGAIGSPAAATAPGTINTTDTHKHILITYDVDNAVAAERFKVHVDGIQYPLAINTVTTSIASTINQNGKYLGVLGYGDTGWNGANENTGLEGYASDIHFIDGKTYDVSAFGGFDIDGKWVVKKFVENDYGNNGFNLTFEDPTNFLRDFSGRNSTFTSLYLTSADVSDDTPLNNFTILDSTHLGTGIAKSGLEATTTVDYATNGPFHRNNMRLVSGKWYCEAKVITNIALLRVFVSTENLVTASGVPRSISYTNDGTISLGAANIATRATFTTNDVIGIAVDASTSTVEFFKNGVSQGAYVLTDLAPYYIGVNDGTATGSGKILFNFGATPFTYAPPVGYKTISSRNLPSRVSEVEGYGNSATLNYLYDLNSNSLRKLANAPFPIYSKNAKVLASTKEFVSAGKVYSVKTIFEGGINKLVVVAYEIETDSWEKIVDAPTGYNKLAYIGNFTVGRVYLAVDSSDDSFEFFTLNTITNTFTSISATFSGYAYNLGAIKISDTQVRIPFFVNKADNYKPYNYYYTFNVIDQTLVQGTYTPAEMLLFPATMGDSISYEKMSNGDDTFFGFSKWVGNRYVSPLDDVLVLS